MELKLHEKLLVPRTAGEFLTDCFLGVCPAPSSPPVKQSRWAAYLSPVERGSHFQIASLCPLLPNPGLFSQPWPLVFSELNPCSICWVLLSSLAWREMELKRSFLLFLEQGMSTHRHFNSLSWADLSKLVVVDSSACRGQAGNVTERGERSEDHRDGWGLWQTGRCLSFFSSYPAPVMVAWWLRQ